MADSGKQQALVNSIASGVHDRVAVSIAALGAQLGAENRALAIQNAQMAVVCNSILGRLATLEDAIASNGAAAKRVTRTGVGAAGGKKPAAKPAAAGAKKAPATAGNVTNALLFFRKAMADNINGIRDEFGTEENLMEARNDATVAKVPEDDELRWYSAVGAYLWRVVLIEDQKANMRNQFNTWKEARDREQAEEPLEEDAAE